MARILVVEDEAFLAEQVCEDLRRLNHEVTLAEDGRTAKRRLRTTSYDVILCDLRLPVQDGLSVVHTARRKKKIPRIIVTTAEHTLDIILRSYNSGADFFLRKPFVLNDVKNALKQVMEA